jgi:hypothetical protein
VEGYWTISLKSSRVGISRWIRESHQHLSLNVYPLAAR